MPVIKEFYGHAKFVNKQERVYLFCGEEFVTSKELRARNKKNNLKQRSKVETLSSLLCDSAKSACMTYLVELMVGFGHDCLLPLVVKDDGVLFATFGQFSPTVEDKFNDLFNLYLIEQIGMYAPLTFEQNILTLKR